MDAEERQRFAALAKAVADQRDESAFSVLFDYFAPRLKSWLMRQKMTSGEAEELVQEIMIVLWHKAALYDPSRSSLSTWLFRIARNRRIDQQRRARVRVLDGEDPTLQPPEEMRADEIVANDDRDAQVRDAVSQLPRSSGHFSRLPSFLASRIRKSLTRPACHSAR